MTHALYASVERTLIDVAARSDFFRRLVLAGAVERPLLSVFVCADVRRVGQKTRPF